MIRFAQEYSINPILQQAVAKLPDNHLLWKVLFAEYALRDIHKPIGISDYELTRTLQGIDMMTMMNNKQIINPDLCQKKFSRFALT
jgi:hypothetical protein